MNKQMSGDGQFKPVRFNGWPELREAFISKNLEATFILAPMIIKMREQGIPVKFLYLGHRDGHPVMVHKDSAIREIKDLVGKKIAIPSKFAPHHLLLYKAFKSKGLKLDPNQLIEMPPPEMPAALASKSVDAITSGEPLMAKTEMEGYGRVLFMCQAVWPEFIS
jgi:NitT/TauT family transport system substrate-binding protein